MRTYGFCLGDPGTEYNSAQFSDVFHAIFGNGITPYGSQFALTVGGFTVTLASGYALAAGRWVENNAPLPLTVPLFSNNEDRTDALVCRVDYAARKASLEVLVGVDVDAIRANPSLLRGNGEYKLLLYLIRVQRGATSLSIEDVTDLRQDKDLCGSITSLEKRAESVLYVYRFFTEVLDAEETRLLGLIDQVIQKADKSVEKLEADIRDTGLVPEIGELQISLFPPAPVREWLLCNGGQIPSEYPELSELLGDTLPNIPAFDGRFKTYIYSGKPAEV